jgi:hypothetical protein
MLPIISYRRDFIIETSDNAIIRDYSRPMSRECYSVPIPLQFRDFVIGKYAAGAPTRRVVPRITINSNLIGSERERSKRHTEHSELSSDRRPS